jgi:hypothetical protein
MSKLFKEVTPLINPIVVKLPAMFSAKYELLHALYSAGPLFPTLCGLFSTKQGAAGQSIKKSKRTRGHGSNPSGVITTVK